MKKLKDALKKKPEELNDEEKSVIKDNWDLLNDAYRATFKDVGPVEDPKKPEGDEDADDEGIDEEELEKMLDGKTLKYMEKKSEEIAQNLVKMFASKFEAQRKQFEKTGKTEKNKENDEVTKKFLKALLSGDMSTLQSMKAIDTTSNGSGADAGYLIPAPLANEVMRIIPQNYGVARSLFAYNLITEGNSKRVTALGSTLSVYWLDEGEKKPSSQPSFKIVTLALKKLAVIVPFTEESVEDAGVDLTGLVATLIAEAFAKEEDLQFINGDGTVWTGIFNDTNIPADTLAATKYAAAVRPEDIIGMVDNTALGINGVYLMHRTVLSKVRTLRENADGTGNYIYNVLGQAGGGANGNFDAGTLNGHPVVLSEAAPTYTQANATGKPIMMYGDFKAGVAYGEKSDIRLKPLDQATITDVDGETVINLAEQDMIALRAVKRVGFKVVLPTAMRRLVSGPAS